MAKTKSSKTESKISPCRRIVVKLGTSLLTGGSDRLSEEIMAMLVGQLAKLHKQGLEILVVSSGAIAAGRYKLGLGKRKDIPYKQVLAAVGQGLLMNIYDQLFGEQDITVAQALLTKADLSDRGIKTADLADQVEGGTLVIRAHGVRPSISTSMILGDPPWRTGTVSQIDDGQKNLFIPD